MNLVGDPRGGTACVCMCGRKLCVGQEATLWCGEARWLGELGCTPLAPVGEGWAASQSVQLFNYLTRRLQAKA